MTLDQGIALFTACATFGSLIFVGLQLRDGINQRKVETQVRLYDINRELLTLGFSLPELFDVISGKSKIDPKIERRYLQMWLNQLSLANSLKRHKFFDKEVQESFDVDFKDIMQMPNMREHWKHFGKYYPASFQESVSKLYDETGAKHAKGIKH